MNIKLINFFKNFSYTFVSNLVTMLVSVTIVLILPKFLGVEDYGYFQLFIFYSSYVGFLHFGWNDGIYLRYGGYYYNDLDYRKLNGQFILLVIFQLIITLVALLGVGLYVIDENRSYIFYMVLLTLIIVNSRHMLIFILQATNRIKEFAILNFLEKVIFVVLVVSFILIGLVDFRMFILSDVIGKFITFILAIIYCREIVFQNLKNISIDIKETIENINVGIKLMVANIAGTLIIGVVRFGIERSWDVSTFGKVSLTLSISNFMMVFINAIGIILFPMLRRIHTNKLSSVYKIIRNLLGVSFIGALLLFFPLKEVLFHWLPNYSDSLKYMALVFPMIVYEGKTALLLNTYFKALRKEKIMLKVNTLSLLLSLFLTLICAFVLKNLEFTVFTILILLAFKSILAEMILSKYLKVTVKKDIILELSMTAFFVSISWYFNTWTGLLLYIIIYVIYILLKFRELVSSIKSVKMILKNS